MSLERFKRAQEDPRSGVAAALAELRSGRKTGHWIWYVFPQLSGLGTSDASRTYGIDDAAEAAAYLRDATLRGRLLSAATTVAEQQRAGVRLLRLMGSSIDVVKLVSSLTLFGRIATDLHATEPDADYVRLADVAAAILEGAEREGYPPCRITLERLQAS